ncbi:TPA: retron system putative HNH endonuclease [Streptococcus suis]
MILISKNQEPNSMNTYRLKKGSTYANMPSQVKSDLKKSLLMEQNSLCAYCMSTITFESMKVEHYIPQSIDPGKELEYGNLLGVCKGNEGKSSDRQTCDTKKGNTMITINPLNDIHILSLSYEPSTGQILSTNFQKDLDDILNLNDNNGFIKSNRLITLQRFKCDLGRKFKQKTLTKEQVKKLHTQYLSSCNPYKGIILWYLNKKLSRI